MGADVQVWDNEQKALIKEQVAAGCSDAELRLFAQVCAKNGLDPFTRQIYAIKRGNKMTIQTSIDGFRVVAERTGRYEGQTPKQWCGDDGVWVDVWLKREHPSAARVGVWKTGFREPLFAVATWAEYAQDQGLWKKMGAHMLAKCAESLALRAAFPNDLAGLYSEDEMSAVGTPEPQRHAPPSRGGGAPARKDGEGSPGPVDTPAALPANKGGPVDIQSSTQVRPQQTAPKKHAPPTANRGPEPAVEVPTPVQDVTSESAPAEDPRFATRPGEQPFTDADVTLCSKDELKALRAELAKLDKEARASISDAWVAAELPSVTTARVYDKKHYEVALKLVLDAAEKQAEREATAESERPFTDEEGAA